MIDVCALCPKRHKARRHHQQADRAASCISPSAAVRPVCQRRGSLGARPIPMRSIYLSVRSTAQIQYTGSVYMQLCHRSCLRTLLLLDPRLARTSIDHFSRRVGARRPGRRPAGWGLNSSTRVGWGRAQLASRVRVHACARCGRDEPGAAAPLVGHSPHHRDRGGEAGSQPGPRRAARTCAV